MMFRGDITGNNVYLSFDIWGNRTWFLTNEASGIAYHIYFS
jgi:hypothetical protein